MRPLLETLRAMTAARGEPVAGHVPRQTYFCAYEQDCFVMTADDAAMNATQRQTLSHQTARLADNLADLSVFSRVHRPPLEVVQFNYTAFAPHDNPVPRITFGIAGDNFMASDEIEEIVSEIMFLTFSDDAPGPEAPPLLPPAADATPVSAASSFSVVMLIFVLMAWLGCRRRPNRPASLLPPRDHWE